MEAIAIALEFMEQTKAAQEQKVKCLIMITKSSYKNFSGFALKAGYSA